jgi:hypothetical protein
MVVGRGFDHDRPSWGDVEKLLAERGLEVDHVTITAGCCVHTAAG